MIEENVKIHDKNSAEIKVGFIARKKLPKSRFMFNIWMFIPNSLDVNRFTYSKTAFYRDMKSNIRLITPVYILRDIADANNSPLVYLEESFLNLASQPTRTNNVQYEYQIKMFLSIFKSSLREEVEHMGKSKTEDLDYLVADYSKYIKIITERYRNLYKIINVPTVESRQMIVFRNGDEFMSNAIEFHTFRIIKAINEGNQADGVQKNPTLMEIIQSEIQYRIEKEYPVVVENDTEENNKLIYHLSMLKKFAESHLFLNIDKRKDGALAEQVLYSLAAGISMVFATVIAFSFQQKYGNFTIPFFVALVVSYMLKDRIKELSRFYFAHKLGARYFDHKISMRVHDEDIGWAKESMDFIPDKKVPVEILKKRNEKNYSEAQIPPNTEKVLLYRTNMFIDRKKLDATSEYSILGVNAIIRYNVLRLMRNMDNVNFPLYFPENNSYKVILGEKQYYVHFVIQKVNDDQNEIQCYRMTLSRKGIRKLEKVEN